MDNACIFAVLQARSRWTSDFDPIIWTIVISGVTEEKYRYSSGAAVGTRIVLSRTMLPFVVVFNVDFARTWVPKEYLIK